MTDIGMTSKNIMTMKAPTKPKVAQMRNCYHCANLICDSSCGYWCNVNGRIVLSSEVLAATNCERYEFDSKTIIGYKNGK